MDRDRVVGSAKVIEGKVKEAVRKTVGDAKLETEGMAEKIEGGVQNALGSLKDAPRGKWPRGRIHAALFLSYSTSVASVGASAGTAMVSDMAVSASSSFSFWFRPAASRAVAAKVRAGFGEPVTLACSRP